MTKSRYFFLVLVLGALTALSPFSIDMYLPSFPQIAASLHSLPARVSLSVSSYFLGLAGGQLLYGPLLDRFGRKPPLFAGLLLYIAACAGCMGVRTVDELIIIRFVQAIGGCAAGVASMAMVRDLFPVKDIPKVFSLLILVLGASPMLAPTIGGYLADHFDWRLIFLVLLGMGAAMLLIVFFFLPESHKADKTISLKPAPIISGFWAILREPAFYTYTLSGSIAFSGLFVYVSGSPIVFMDLFGLSATMFSWIFAGLSVGFIGASQLNTVVLRRFRSEQLVLWAMVVQVGAGVALFIAAWAGWLSLASMLGLLFVFLCTIGFINPNAAGLSLAPFSRNAGSASALMGALQMGIGASISSMVGVFNTLSAVPMTAIMASSAVVALAVLLVGRRTITGPLNVAQDAISLH